MGELVPVTASPPPVPTPGLLSPLTDPAGGSVLTRLRSFAAQGPVRRLMPWFLGVSALGGAVLAWSAIAPSPQRMLYGQLDDGERASVATALDGAAIAYHIDNQTGALTVDESDYYRARMLVASDNALATPEGGSEVIDTLPIGASRTLEGERLREAHERDLRLTIMQIDGVEAVRVHLAQAEKSVFVREDVPPTASVMVRLARGRHLSDGQVAAIVNLVAASVPGLAPEAVRVVDQSGRLLSDPSRTDADRLELQARMEDKLRGQVSQLLAPMLGERNFSSEIQVELDMDQVTSARESYDKQGAVRSETEQQSQTTGPAQTGGVPGVLANTPPPPTTAQPGPPQGTQPPAQQQTPLNTDSSTKKTYELGREVSVANTSPGKLARLSVAVAISADALKGGKPADLEQIKQLISAAVGADEKRGDQIAVMVRKFEAIEPMASPFYEAPWFATLVRYGAALIAVLLVLLLGVRPLIKAPTRERPAGGVLDEDDRGEATASNGTPARTKAAQSRADARTIALPVTDPATGRPDTELLTRKVGFAQRLVAEKPDSAVAALRQMLAHEPAAEEAA